MQLIYVCSLCGHFYEIDDKNYQCTCGGLLDLHGDLRPFSEKDIVKSQWSLLRYEKTLPFEDSSSLKEMTMGEGMTPLLPLDKKYPHLLVKVEYLMPTLSFKDRGSVILMAKAKEFGVKRVIQDSSGNAGHSIAAYAARGKIECHIYVPQKTSKKKIEEMRRHRASVHIVEGTREDAAKEARKAVERGEGFYGSHVYNPFFYQGTKTYIYEIYEQLRGSLPSLLFIPIGNGTLLLGAYYGCLDLLKEGFIERVPRLIGVQAENCSPLFDAMMKRDDRSLHYKETIAEGIAIADPKRGPQILDTIESTRGEMVAVDEEEILLGLKYLASKGLSVEPTTASTLAGYFKYCRKKKEAIHELTVLPLGGAGLKALK